MEVGKVIKRGEDLFFFLWLFTFENNGNLFWVYQNMNFLLGKKSGKITLPPQKNMPIMPLTIGTASRGTRVLNESA